MVYRGKPSKGCFQCRRRRIKCDQKRPGCTQCSNSGVPCAGYRKAEDLMFLDETASTTQKYTSRSKTLSPDELHTEDGSRPSSSSSSAGQQPSSASSNGSWQVTVPPSPMQLARPPSIRVDDLALCFFLRNYVYHSRFDYVPGMYNSCVQKQSPLAASVSACALASLSFELESTKIAAVARKRYARALSLTNDALARPQEAVRDDTLASVLVLSLFETITQADEFSQASWEAHVKGAAMLLRMRGQEQFQSFLGRTLYLHAADSIRISCFQNAHAVPKELQVLDELASVQTESLRVQLHTMVTNLAQLRASINESQNIDAASLTHRYRAFETEVIALTSSHSSLLDYSEHHVAPSAEIFEGVYHMYGDKINLRISNVLQMMLVWLNEQIYNAWASSSSRDGLALQGEDGADEHTAHQAAERLHAATCAATAARAICASVPQLMGDVVPADGSDPSGAAAGGGLSSAIALIWPLSMMGERAFLPDPLRNYAIAQLRRIGTRNKIPQATITAEALAGARTKRLWVHMYHIT